jgi:hypothetical protein
MKFAMEFFYHISFGFQFYSAQYISKRNDFVVTKHQVPLGTKKYVKFDLHEME